MADTAQPSPFTEFIGVCNTTRKNGTDNCTNIDVYVPDMVMEDKCCPSKTKVYSVGVEKLFSCPGGSHKITKKKCLTCSYLGGSNCLIPCVHVGERVRVLNYGGDEHFYWLPLGRDNGIRLRERIRWFAMSQPKSISGDTYEEVTDENSYFIDINTNCGAKQVHLHTSKKDGESYKYDMYILPVEGIWKFHDCQGNILKLESGPHWWYMRNVDDSIVECKAENINILCKDTITMRAGKNIIAEAGVNIDYTAGQDISVKDGNAMTINSGATFDRVCPKQTITGDDRSSTFSNSDMFVASTIGLSASDSFVAMGGGIAIQADGTMTVQAATAAFTANSSFAGSGFVVNTSGSITPLGLSW